MDINTKLRIVVTVLWFIIAVYMSIHIRWAITQIDKRLDEMRNIERRSLGKHFTDRKDTSN